MRKPLPLKLSCLWPISVAAMLSASVLALATAASAQSQVGAANKITNSVTGSVGNRQLKSADPVFADESISAAERSLGELQLNDNSRVLVGENSTVVLDKFVVGSGGIEAGTVRVAKGAFRFISGGGAENVRIATPLATIGVRGTAFDVYTIPASLSLSGTEETAVVVLDGQVIVCGNFGGGCLLTQRRCDIIRVPTAGNAARAPFFLSRRWTAQQSALFNLLYNQQRFGSQWRVPTLACNARAAQEAQNSGRNEQQSGDSNKDPPSLPDPPAPPAPYPDFY